VLIRPATEGDLPFLRRMLYEAACWQPGDRPTSEQVLSAPRVARYLEDWVRPGDEGIVAVEAGESIGAAWYRLFPAGAGGYGYVSEEVPELTMAVSPEARGRGVGGALLRALVHVAQDAGYSALSLSVEVDNEVACRLYRRAGFMAVASDGGAATMLLELETS
jgi:ribosomal protein S18 acetylase RimI-like enzyme